MPRACDSEYRHLVRYLLLAAALAVLSFPACIATTECDENTSCSGSRVCFRSRSTGGGYCTPQCVAEDGACPMDAVCRTCASSVGNLCLPATSDTADLQVCAPCVCDPQCPVGSGCIDGVCIPSATGCMCAGAEC